MGEVEIVRRPEIRVIGIAHQGAYSSIGPAFQRLSAELGRLGLWPEAREFLGVYLDDPGAVSEAELRALAGIAVRDDLALPEGFDEARIAGGRYAILHHRGAYDGLSRAWTWFAETWLPASGETPRAAPAVEIYRNAPGEVPEAELLTDLGMPIEGDG